MSQPKTDSRFFYHTLPKLGYETAYNYEQEKLYIAIPEDEACAPRGKPGQQEKTTIFFTKDEILNILKASFSINEINLIIKGEALSKSILERLNTALPKELITLKGMFNTAKKNTLIVSPPKPRDPVKSKPTTKTKKSSVKQNIMDIF